MRFAGRGVGASLVWLLGLGRWRAPLMLGALLSVAGASPAGAEIYFLTHQPSETINSIARVDNNGALLHTKWLTGIGRPDGGLAVDGDYIYWTDSSAGTIGRAPLDGHGAPDPYYITDLGAPVDVAVSNGYIYWTDTTAHEVSRARTSSPGTTTQVLLSGPSVPHIAVDSSHLFADVPGAHGFQTNSIWIFAIDGGVVRASFHDVPLPGSSGGMASDGHRLFFATTDHFGGVQDHLGAINVDGSHLVETYVPPDNTPFAPTHPGAGAVAVDQGSIYWSTSEVVFAGSGFNTILGVGVADTATGGHPNWFLTGNNAGTNDGRGAGGIAVDGNSVVQAKVNVSCAGAAVGQSSSCTATLASNASPAGKLANIPIKFASDSPGSFPDGNTCTPDAQGQCSLHYVPSDRGLLGDHHLSVSAGDDVKARMTADGADVAVTEPPRSTAAATACVPASPMVGDAVHCEVTVGDAGSGTRSAPRGAVTLSAPSGTLSNSTCGSLNADGTSPQSTCTFTYLPTGAGGHQITAAYALQGTHAGSSASPTITVAPATPHHATSTAVDCPGPATVNDPTVCTLTVTDNDASPTTPSGTVTLLHAGPAQTSPANSQCTLSSGSCTVTYTPSAIGDAKNDGTFNGTHYLQVVYSGDDSHDTSSSAFIQLTVQPNRRGANLSIACSPASVPVGEHSVCTVTIQDTDSGAKSPPIGIVDLTPQYDGANPIGKFSAPNGLPDTEFGTCYATMISGDTSQCAVDYVPQEQATGTHQITADQPLQPYSTHIHTAGSTNVTVTPPPTATSVACSPANVAVGVPTTCTATVTDVNSISHTTPTGEASFTSRRPGTFSSNQQCTLSGTGDSASCAVTFTPGAGGTETSPIAATAISDPAHDTSAGEADLAVTDPAHPTGTAISCAPASIAAGASTTCDITVTDTDAATPSVPVGPVTVSSNGGGAFDTGGACSLVEDTTSSASCRVVYTAKATSSGSHRLAAAFGGDVDHLASAQATAITVSGASIPLSLTALTETASVWREGSKLAQLTAKHKPPVGTTFSVRLSEAAKLTLTFTQRLSGRKVHHRCVAQTNANRHMPRCKRTLTAGTLALTGHPGQNQIRFYGRLSRTKRLKPGRYTLTITAIDAAQQRATSRPLRFTIVR